MESKVFTIDDVATMLYESFGDTCACNFNCNDEWLPFICKYAQTECPEPKDKLDCWRQFALHFDKHNDVRFNFNE